MSFKSTFSFIIGAAAGAAAVWLLTSEKGREKTSEFRQKAAEGFDTVKNKAKEVKAEVISAVETIEEKVEQQ